MKDLSSVVTGKFPLTYERSCLGYGGGETMLLSNVDFIVELLC